MNGLPIVALVALGLVFFATPVIVLVLILALLNLRSRIRRLEARLAAADRPVAAADVVTAAGPGAASPPPPAASVPPPAPILDAPAEAPAAATPARDDAPVGVAAGAAREAGPPPGSLGAPAPAATGVEQWEGRLGGTWLSRVGALLLFLGVGFFLKHAFEQDWIGPRGRILIGLVAGLAMMGGGIKLAGTATYRVPAQSLVAVGVGVIYLSLYAAHAFYALVGAPGTFVAMAVVTAAGFVTALRLDSRALAVLATVGGLLTPVILNTDTDAAGALFTYLGILDAAVLIVAFRRGWPGLALLAFAGTQILYWGWLDRWYQAVRLRPALGWATVFFLAFALWALAGSRRARPLDSIQLGRSLVILGAPALYFAAARRILDDPAGRRLAVVALALAGLYFVAARM